MSLINKIFIACQIFSGSFGFKEVTLLWISNAWVLEYPLDKLFKSMYIFFLGSQDNVPFSTLSEGNQFTKVMFELFLTSGIFFQDIFSFYRNVCSTNLKQTWDEKLLIFPCAYFWNSYFVISACIDAMKKMNGLMTSIWGKTLPWELPDMDATWKILSPGHCRYNGTKYFLKSPLKYYYLSEISQYINGLMTSI